jgi:hypothetical protein
VAARLCTYRPSQQATADWNRYPLHPGPNATVLPSASRAGDALTLDITPFGDSEPGHRSFSGFAAASRPRQDVACRYGR